MEYLSIEDTEAIDIICSSLVQAYEEVAHKNACEDTYKRRLKTIMKVINDHVHIIPVPKLEFRKISLEKLIPSILESFKKKEPTYSPEKVASIARSVSELAAKLKELKKKCEPLITSKEDMEKYEENTETLEVVRYEEYFEKLIETQKYTSKKAEELTEILKTKKKELENIKNEGEEDDFYKNLWSLHEGWDNS